MWYYFGPGLIFLLLTVALFFFATLFEPGRTGRIDLVGERPPALSADSLRPEKPLPSPALLASTSGKPVLINFFASWCAPCEAEMPFLRELSEKHGIILIGIAWNDTLAKVTPWLRKTEAPFHFTGIDDGTTAGKYGVTGLPESFLLDRTGKVVGHVKGPLTPEIIAEELTPYLGNHLR